MTLFSYHEYSVVQIEKVKVERKQLSLQFDALRNQLSPHYLFNCLNTISSLIYKDADLAESFIRRLAQTYHYILSNNDQHLVPVKEELEFVKSYYYLMKVRFDNSIALQFEISDIVMASQIPPLTLQILVENAIKHNNFSKDDPLEIIIRSEDDKKLIISNNVSSKSKQVTSFKVGLENVSKRYEFFTPIPVKVLKEKSYEVQLPVLSSFKGTAVEEVA
jgi:LytS/YehU family sensor histidine kinase